MKLFFKVLGFLIVLAVVLVAVAIKSVPKDKIQAEIQAKISEQTGLDVTFNSDIDLNIFPNLGLKITDVSLKNPAWASNSKIMDVKSIDVLLALKPLFKKQIVVNHVILDAPEISLVANKKGNGNWDFKAPSSSDISEETRSSADAEASEDLALSINKIEIKNGRLAYEDQKEKTQYIVSDLNLSLQAPDFDKPAQLKADLLYKAEKLALKAIINTPNSLIADQKTNMDFEVSSRALSLKTKGDYAPSKKTLFSGAIDLDIKDLKSLLLLADITDVSDIPMNQMKIATQASLSDGRIDYKGLDFSSDVLNVKGAGSLDYSRAQTLIKGDYSIGSLNLDQLISADETSTVNTGNQKAVTAQKNWDKSAIDYSALKSVNADITAKVAGYIYDGLNVGGNTIDLKMTNGLLKLKMSDTAVFDGTFGGAVTLNAVGSTPKLNASLDVKSMNSQSFLSYFADYKDVSGDLNIGVKNINAQAHSIDRIVKTLSGQVDLEFKDGEVRNVDFVKWANSFQKRVSDVGDTSGATKFVSMGGAFKIKNGIVSNNDFALAGPLVQANGSGTINAPLKTLDYGLVVKLLPNAQHEKSVTTGLDMPFKINGAWDDPKIRADFSKVLKDVLSDPKAAEQQLRNIKEVGKSLEDSFKGDKNAIKDGLKDLKQLKNIFKGF